MRAAKVDANQAEIVKALRSVGCEVAITSSVGDGFPDLVVARAGVNYLFETKDGSKPPSARQLTPKQREFHRRWNARGSVVVVESVMDALRAVGAVRGDGQ